MLSNASLATGQASQITTPIRSAQHSTRLQHTAMVWSGVQEEENESLEAARSAARSAAEREKKARKKERQREKKAAEQAKKEAEDEERRQQEALRQAEVRARLP